MVKKDDKKQFLLLPPLASLNNFKVSKCIQVEVSSPQVKKESKVCKFPLGSKSMMIHHC